MKNLNLKNLLNKANITPIEGEMLKKVKGGIKPKVPNCGVNCVRPPETEL